MTTTTAPRTAITPNHLTDAFAAYRAAYERCYHAGCRRSVAAEAEVKLALADYHAALEREKSEVTKSNTVR